MADDFSARYGDLLTGSYDCVDRIGLNAFFSLGHNPGGFRNWWRPLHDGSDELLDNAHLQRIAGRFARRVRAWAEVNQVPVIYCKAGNANTRSPRSICRPMRSGRGVHGAGGPRQGHGLGRAPLERWCHHQPGEEGRVRQPLLLPHHGQAVGTLDDQDVGVPAVRRADHPQADTSTSPARRRRPG
ncbi:MAG: hypothetical protein JWL97_3481 [Gemmatimonadales bacterium]|jgi:hypothetical protein|nr:hypothetical protein [Gemmatimonadales bacterium]